MYCWVCQAALCFSASHPAVAAAVVISPVERVELHGQHGVRLQGRVRVIGRRPRLLSQLPAVHWSRNQALQDLLHFSKNNPSGDYRAGLGSLSPLVLH